MKYYLKKFSFLILALTLITVSCDTEENYTLTEPDAVFELKSPAISRVVLNFDFPDNQAFTLNWIDEVTGSTNYNIEMATDDLFSNVVTLGSSSSDSFTISVADFNTALNAAGVTSDETAVYLRLNTGAELSNTIFLSVVAFPTEAQEITSPSSGDSFVLDSDMRDLVVTTIEWSDTAPAEYIVEAATPGTNFMDAVELGSTSEKMLELTHDELNRAALATGLVADVSGTMEIRVRSILTSAAGNPLERISEVITITVTPYLSVLDLSTTWGVVGSAANNWGATPDLPFWQTDVDGVLAAYVNLIDGEIKFRENNDWANNFGDNGADGTLDAGGANIAVTAGSYKITLDFNTNTYTIEPFSLGIVGSGYNNWGATPDFMLEYDQYSDVFRGIVTLLDGEIKFRMNNDWGTNWGDNGNDGTMDAGGANIASTAGIYIVTVNLNDLTYTLEEIDSVWGLVGSAYNNWGATPDAQFTRDWSRPFDDIWILRDVTLLDGEYKIRANNDWGTNYGDNGADGTLELNGANIASTAGTYTITLDFSDASSPTYTVQ